MPVLAGIPVGVDESLDEGLIGPKFITQNPAKPQRLAVFGLEPETLDLTPQLWTGCCGH